MNALILAAAVFAASPQVLVTTDGKAMLVQSYTVDGKVVRTVGLDGQPGIMRAEKVDLPKSEAATLARAEADERRATAPVVDPAAEKEAERARIREINARHRARSGGAGGISTARELGHIDVEPAAGEDSHAPPLASHQSDALTAEWMPRVERAQAAYERSQHELEQMVREHDAMVREHDNRYRTTPAGREILRARIATLQDKIATAERQTETLRAEWIAVAGEARAAGAPAVVWRRAP